MARPRGNYLKKKSRLTEENLSAAIDVSAPKAPNVTVDGEPDETEPENFVASILSMLATKADVIDMPEAYNDPARMFINDTLPTVNFILGRTTCSECLTSQIYYEHRELVRHGFGFRCSVCSIEIRVDPASTLPIES